jgi:hypothetical protein
LYNLHHKLIGFCNRYEKCLCVNGLGLNKATCVEQKQFNFGVRGGGGGNEVLLSWCYRLEEIFLFCRIARIVIDCVIDFNAHSTRE